jgi:predicted TIM-barrel fold metal-dependent hydrolase
MSAEALPRTDCHTHVGIDAAFYLAGWLPYASSAQDLLGHMAHAHIDRAACFPNPTPSAFDPWAFAEHRELRQLPGRVPYAQENTVLIAELRRVDTHGQLLPFGMFDPDRNVAEQVAHLQTLAGDLKGLKSQPTLLQSPVRQLLGPSRPLMEFAEAHDLPVVLHTSVEPNDRWSQTMDCLEVASEFPRVRFSMAHSMRFHAPSLRLASQLDNVWVDCSAHLLHCELALRASPVVAPPAERVDADFADPADVLRVVHEILDGKYVWGSDSPYQSWSDDDFTSIHTYSQEVDVLAELPAQLRSSMLSFAPDAWLCGT